MEELEFQSFGKIARLSRRIVITEKLDGTNGQILIADDGVTMRAGSRNRFVGPGENFGFGSWAEENRAELLKLGPGRHFGEWWGSGIQRGYGLQKGEKRFSLFNTGKWVRPEANPEELLDGQYLAPKCCSVVPILYEGDFNTDAALACIEQLRAEGSKAAPGFMNPEGIIVYHTAGNIYFKKTLDKDESYKGAG